MSSLLSRRTLKGLGIVHKVPLPSAEELLDGTLHLVLGVVSAPDFPLWSTPDAEWLERREDDVLVDYNSDNVADVLVQLLSEFVELCGKKASAFSSFVVLLISVLFCCDFSIGNCGQLYY